MSTKILIEEPIFYSHVQVYTHEESVDFIRNRLLNIAKETCGYNGIVGFTRKEKAQQQLPVLDNVTRCNIPTNLLKDFRRAAATEDRKNIMLIGISEENISPEIPMTKIAFQTTEENCGSKFAALAFLIQQRYPTATAQITQFHELLQIMIAAPVECTDEIFQMIRKTQTGEIDIPQISPLTPQ